MVGAPTGSLPRSPEATRRGASAPPRAPIGPPAPSSMPSPRPLADRGRNAAPTKEQSGRRDWMTPDPPSTTKPYVRFDLDSTLRKPFGSPPQAARPCSPSSPLSPAARPDHIPSRLARDSRDTRREGTTGFEITAPNGHTNSGFLRCTHATYAIASKMFHLHVSVISDFGNATVVSQLSASSCSFIASWIEGP